MKALRSGVSRCDVCKKNKEKITGYKNEWGFYSACPECSEEMKLTMICLKMSTKQVLEKNWAKYKINPNSIVITPLE